MGVEAVVPSQSAEEGCTVVIGLLPSANAASVCLSNLAEEGFEPAAISVATKTPRDATALADAAGPLTALPPDELSKRLTQRGLSPAEAEAYRDGILKGEVFLAVSAGAADDAARETLGDHGGRLVRLLPDAPAEQRA